MVTSASVDQILPALLSVKSKLEGVTKSSNNPYFKSKYADLNSHLDAVEPLLAQHGLALFQPISYDVVTGKNIVTSMIMHSSGQFIKSEMSLMTKEEDMQKLGSAVTYARRYTLGSLLSMKAVDDDGEAAVGRTEKVKVEKSEVKPVDSVAATPVATAAPRRPSFRKNVSASTSTSDDI